MSLTIPIQYKEQIDEEINKLALNQNNIQLIYGGSTTDTIENKKEQHIKEYGSNNNGDADDKDWNIKTITTHVVIHNDIDKELAEKLEKYIVQSLQDKFGDKAQTTPSSTTNPVVPLNFLDKITFYVLYKLNKNE